MKEKEKATKNIKVTPSVYKQLEEYKIKSETTFNHVIKELIKLPKKNNYNLLR